MKKIVIFIPSLSFGGAERVTSILANYLSQKFEVTLITNFVDSKEYGLDSKVTRLVLSSKGVVDQIKEIRQILKKIQPYCTITMFAPMYIYTYFAQLGLNIPQIVSERNDPRRFAGRIVTKKLYQYLLKKANGIVFQTREAEEFYYKNGISKATIIYNPIITAKLPDVNLENRKKRVINIGRLHPQKNQKMLISAFKRIHHKYPEYTLDIFGAGELEEELNDFISENNASEYVHLKGTTSKVAEELNSSEMFVLSSDFEGMPNTLIEAMCMGVPSISTDCPCGGPRELIKDGVNGLLTPVGDANKLAEKMDAILGNYELRENLSNNAVKLRRKLDVDKICDEWIEFIKYITKGHEK